MRPQVIVVATLLLNAALFFFNFLVADLSGSRTVLSQAIYTVTDFVGSAFLLGGLYLSRRPADYDHPFGHGRERFFWAFVSILVTFTVSGLLAISVGLGQVANPSPISHVGDALLVVAATLITSLGGILVTLRELRRSRRSLESFLSSTSFGLKSIFYQDLAAIVGSIVAVVGLVVVYRTGSDEADGITAVLLGLVLLAAGIVLAAESREYLVGRALEPRDARGMIAIVGKNPRVSKVRDFQSMMLGPEDALLALRINFQDGLTTDQLEETIDQVAASVKAAYPIIHHVVIEPES